MKKIIRFYKKHKFAIDISFLFLLGLFFRVYKLPSFISYHQDQVRDLMIIKEHFYTHQFIFLGPKASIGNFYLPPFWYHLMAVGYFFSKSPVAPAFIVAFFSSLTTIVIYLFSNKFFNQKTAFFASLFYAFSPLSIEYSRFAWNPNPVPFFAITTFYFLYLYLFEKKQEGFYLSIIFANLTLQLHYQGFIIFAFLFFILWKEKKFNFKNSFIYLLINLFLIFPFFIYEMKFGFKNTLGIINALKNSPSHFKIFGIPHFIKFMTLNFSIFLGRIFGVKNYFLDTFFYLILFFALLKKWKNKEAKILKNYFLFTFVILFFYKNSLIDFYLLFLIPFLIIYLTYFLEKKLAKKLFSLFFISLFLFNFIYNPAFKKKDMTYLKLRRTITSLSNKKNYCVFYDIFSETFIENKLRYLVSLRTNQPEDENKCRFLKIACVAGIEKIYYICQPEKCDLRKFPYRQNKLIKNNSYSSGLKIYEIGN